MSAEAELEARLVAILRASPRLMTVLEEVAALALPDWRLVSGAVYGTVWNALTGRPADHGIKDFDIGYFDTDLSWEAEDVFIRAAAARFQPPLRDLVEVRNQARVHLWFGAKFGGDYPPLRDTDEALTRYLCFAHAVGVRLEPDGQISVAAPFGLADVFDMVLRPNPQRGGGAAVERNRADKCAAIQARWPEVRMMAGEQA